MAVWSRGRGLVGDGRSAPSVFGRGGAVGPGALAAVLAGCAGGAVVWPRPAGTAAWEAAARGSLARWDRDGSGVLEAAEVTVVDCADWRRLDDAVFGDTGSGLAVLYGIDAGLLWRGDALGLAASAREAAAQSLGRCVERRAARESEERAALAALTEIAEQPSSGAWDAVVRGILLGAWDADASGWLDTPSEIEGVPCEVWRALDEAILAGRGQPLKVLYGFSDGYAWAGDALGCHPSMQPVAERAMGACGLAGD